MILNKKNSSVFPLAPLMRKGTPFHERGGPAAHVLPPRRRDACHGISSSDSSQPARRFSSHCPDWGPRARGSSRRITGTSTMGTGTTGGNIMRARATRTAGTDAAIIGGDIAGTGTTGTGHMGADITDTPGGATGITCAVTALAVNTGPGILRRRTCTLLPISICRASTCTSCFRCSDGRAAFGTTTIWRMPHAHRTVFYRGRIR